jgi:hypothetical protein
MMATEDLAGPLEVREPLFQGAPEDTSNHTYAAESLFQLTHLGKRCVMFVFVLQCIQKSECCSGCCVDEKCAPCK